MSNNSKFVVMQAFRDEYGTPYTGRVDMRGYTEHTARRKADEVRGGYVCPMGSNNPVYVGEWQ